MRETLANAIQQLADEEIKSLRAQIAERDERIGRLWKAVTDMKAAIETAGYVFRNTDSGPNLVR